MSLLRFKRFLLFVNFKNTFSGLDVLNYCAEEFVIINNNRMLRGIWNLVKSSNN